MDDLSTQVEIFRDALREVSRTEYPDGWIDAARRVGDAASRCIEYERELDRKAWIRAEHDCGCEICSRTTEPCPATASSYAEEIAHLRQRIGKQAIAYQAVCSERDRLRALRETIGRELRNQERPGGTPLSDWERGRTYGLAFALGEIANAIGDEATRTSLYDATREGPGHDLE